MKKSKDKIEILFSGGFDSTFMLCLLARTKTIPIQPYYLDIKRHIRNDERRAIKNIINVLQKKTDLKAKILPVKFIDQKYFVPSDDVQQAWEKYKDLPYEIGGQQRYLAEFSKIHHGICWGQERYLETPGHMTRLLMDKGNWKFTNDGVGYFTKEDCDPDVFLLFGNLIAPVAKYSEPMMWSKIKEWGYEDVFKHIRFCYYPVDGKPCGMCLPCQVKLKQKMDFLFTKESIQNGKVMRDLLDMEKLMQKSLYMSNFQKSCLFKISELFMMYRNSVVKQNFIRGIVGNDDTLLLKVESIICSYTNYFDSLLNKYK